MGAVIVHSRWCLMTHLLMPLVISASVVYEETVVFMGLLQWTFLTASLKPVENY